MDPDWVEKRANVIPRSEIDHLKEQRDQATKNFDAISLANDKLMEANELLRHQRSLLYEHERELRDRINALEDELRFLKTGEGQIRYYNNLVPNVPKATFAATQLPAALTVLVQDLLEHARMETNVTIRHKENGDTEIRFEAVPVLM